LLVEVLAALVRRRILVKYCVLHQYELWKLNKNPSLSSGSNGLKLVQDLKKAANELTERV